MQSFTDLSSKVPEKKPKTFITSLQEKVHVNFLGDTAGQTDTHRYKDSLLFESQSTLMITHQN